MRLIQLASVTIHLLAAASWFGAMVFIVAALVPAMRGRELAERRQILSAAARRLRALVWPLFALLIATGVLQLWLRGYRWPDVAGAMWQGAPGHALALKLTLFGAALVLAALHDFAIGPRAAAAPEGSRARERGRRLAGLLGRISMLLAVGILAAAVAFVRGGFSP